MNECFENEFSNIQMDMIAICMEYIENKGDKIYIYASYENKCIACDFFYDIDGALYERHKLPSNYNTDSDRQMKCMEILTNDVEELIKICLSYNRDMPTEIKIIYDIRENKVNANYKYEIVYSNKGLFADRIVDDWFNEINSSI